MKNIRLLILLFSITIIGNISFSQYGLFEYEYKKVLTTEEKQQYISKLDSADNSTRWDAILTLTYSGVIEAIPKIEENIWKNPESNIKILFLEALWKLGSPNTLNFARAFIDTARTFPFKPFKYRDDSLEYMIDATQILFDYHDYSTTELIFKLLSRDSSRVDFDARDLLKKVIQNVPEYSNRAKTKLIQIVSYGDDDARYYSLKDLVDLYGSEMMELDLNVANNDTASINRWVAWKILSQLNYPHYKSFLKSRLINEPSWGYRTDIAESLLVKYGIPDDYKFVQDYNLQEPNTTTQSLINSMLKYFEPPRSPDTIFVIEMVDSLINTKHQVAYYTWLNDQSFVNELDSNLTVARSYIIAGDSNNCARQIKLFQQKVDEEYRDSLDGDNKTVTIEGWKFLYYNAQYILERLPIPPSQYNLNINVNGNGTVTKSPELALYDSASTVTLTANPSSGYRFSQWSGDASGTSNPITVTMNNNKTITATFEQNIFIITATSGANGTITPNGDVSVTYGTNQSFTISPSTGYHVDSVIVDGIKVDSTTSYTFTNVTAPHTITVSFAINTYTLSINATNGTVAKNPDQATYNHGTSVQLTATPSTGYHFVNWTGDLTGTTNPASIAMNANKTVTANFAINTYTLTVNASNGTVIKTPDQATYNHGTSVQLTATPAAGYHFVNWTGDVTGTSNPISIMMDGNKTITANFAINTYTLTIQISGSGTVLKYPNQTSYTSGTSVRLTAKATIDALKVITPNTPEPTSWRFDHWEIDLTGTQNPKSIIMNGNKTVKAVFVPVY